MPKIEITINVTIDGQPFSAAYPLSYSLSAGEMDTWPTIIKPDGDSSGTYWSFSRLSTLAGFLMTTDQPIFLGFLNQQTGLELDAGGFVLAAGVNMASGASNVIVSNQGSSAANITGFEFGA